MGGGTMQYNQKTQGGRWEFANVSSDVLLKTSELYFCFLSSFRTF